MSGHSNDDIKKHIDDNGTLLQKMQALAGELQTELLHNFESLMGVPLPNVIQAEVRQLEYAMVYSSDPITDEYMSGAKTLLDGAFGGDLVDVANKALDVVQTLLSNIVGKSTIQTGGSNQSMRIVKGSRHFVSASFAQTEECSSQDWLTQTNFYVSFYTFVVWEPDEKSLETIVNHHKNLAVVHV